MIMTLTGKPSNSCIMHYNCLANPLDQFSRFLYNKYFKISFFDNVLIYNI